jgi:cytoskeletal protein CcmA (bactofilin family)
LSYFSQKNERDMKAVKPNEPTLNAPAPSANPIPEIVSTLGHGMLITGNIVCAGAVQIFGRVIGDIHAAKLTICEGANVVGNIIAPETVVQGSFKGTIHANNVKLQSTASVDGEIFNKLITIEQNALFEGVARRLDQPVAPPTSEQLKGEQAAAAPVAQPAPLSQPAPLAQPAPSLVSPATASDFRTRLSQISDLRA